MKKLILGVFIAFALVATAYAATTVLSTYKSTVYEFRSVSMELSADASDAAFDTAMSGGYLYQVDIVTSADDAITFTIKSHQGSQMYTTTTTAATGGEIELVPSFFAIPDGTLPTYTLSGLGSGTATIEVTKVQ